MKSIPCFVANLERENIQLDIVKDGLRVTAEGTLSNSLRVLLKDRKDEISLYLSALDNAMPSNLSGRRLKFAPSLIQKGWWAWMKDAKIQNRNDRILGVAQVSCRENNQIEGAIRSILLRHPVLRASFSRLDETGTLELNEIEDLQIPVKDLSKTSKPAEEARQIAKKFADEPIPIRGKWLFKMQVLRVGPAKLFCIFAIHHIIADARSASIIQRQIKELAESPSVKHARRVHFFDYVEHERRWFSGASGASVSRYWYAWHCAVPDLRSPSTGRLLRWLPGDVLFYYFNLPISLVEALRITARKLQTSLFFLCMAAYATCLSKWSGRSRFSLRCTGDMRYTVVAPDLVGNMVCFDLVQVQMDSKKNLVALIKDLEDEYKAAMILRLPNVHKFPCHPDIVDYSKRRLAEIAPTFNFVPNAIDRGSNPFGTQPPKVQWPPIMSGPVVETWDVPAWPIYLYLGEKVDRIACRLQINSASIPVAHHTKISNLLLEAFIEISAVGTTF